MKLSTTAGYVLYLYESGALTSSDRVSVLGKRGGKVMQKPVT